MGDEFSSDGWDFGPGSDATYDTGSNYGPFEGSYSPSPDILQDEAGQMWIRGNNGELIKLPSGSGGQSIPQEGQGNYSAFPDGRILAALMQQFGVDEQGIPNSTQSEMPPTEGAAPPAQQLSPTQQAAAALGLGGGQRLPTQVGTPTEGDGSDKKTTTAAPKVSLMNQPMTNEKGEINWQKLLGLGLTAGGGLMGYMNANAANKASNAAYKRDIGMQDSALANYAAQQNRVDKKRLPTDYVTQVAGTRFKGAA